MTTTEHEGPRTPSHSEPPPREWLERNRYSPLEDWIDALIATWDVRGLPGAQGKMSRSERLSFIRQELGWRLPSWGSYRFLCEWYDGPWGRDEEAKGEREMIVQRFLAKQPKRVEGGCEYVAAYSLGAHVAAFKASRLKQYPPKSSVLAAPEPRPRLGSGRQPDMEF